MLSALTDGGARPEPHAGHSRRRRRSDAAQRNRQRQRHAGPFHCGSIELLVEPPMLGLRYVNLQTGAIRHLALRPSEGASVGRLAAMDDRRAGQPPGQGQSARRAPRRRRRRPGQRRDVHRRSPAPLVSHAAAPRGAALPQRLALQGGVAGRFAHRLAGHDQSRQGSPKRPTATSANDNLMLSDDALGPIRFPASKSKPTTSAARTAPRPAASTKNKSSTPVRAGSPVKKRSA